MFSKSGLAGVYASVRELAENVEELGAYVAGVTLVTPEEERLLKAIAGAGYLLRLVVGDAGAILNYTDEEANLGLETFIADLTAAFNKG